MRKLVLLTFLLVVGFTLSAQSLSQVVHLKNGNMIRGEIVEMIPDESLTIRSGDGKLYTYQMSEVTSIKQNTSSISKLDNDPIYGDAVNSTSPLRRKTTFRTFIEAGYSVNVRKVKEYENKTDYNRFELSFTLGNQFNDLFYLGIGSGVSYFPHYSKISYPVFFNPRFNINSRSDPSFLIDLKVGYALGQQDTRGFYAFSGVGLRFAPASSARVNVLLGFTNYIVDGVVYKETYYGHYYEKTKVNLGAITLKLGLDF